MRTRNGYYRRSNTELAPIKRGRGEVPVGPFRDEFIRQYNEDIITLSDVAQRLGQKRTETSYVQITLGLRPYKANKRTELTRHGNLKSRRGTGETGKKGNNSGWRYKEHIEYPLAVKLAEILNMDPVDAGI
jgi:hypothetical protein